MFDLVVVNKISLLQP